MLKQELKQKLLQKLTPQQIQIIKLLEIPVYQLEQKIKKELEENPILEEGADQGEETTEVEDTSNEDSNNEEFSLDDFVQDEDIPYYKLTTRNQGTQEKREEIPFSTGTTFQEHLENQLGMRMLNERQHQLANYLLGNLDDDGYLRRDLESITDDLAFNENIDTDVAELEKILLSIIQDMDPPGVGARDLRECLLLQIEAKDQSEEQVRLAKSIIEHNFESFTKKHYDKILQQQSISNEQLKGAIDEILRLYPKPGSSFSESSHQVLEHIVPDFILENRDGELFLRLNQKNMPDLRLSSTYMDMMETRAQKNSKKDKEALSFVRQKINSAKWFIDAIRQRQITLMLTMQAILDFQYDYFIDGNETKLKPMILKDIAEETGLDISTVSRVVNSKYIQTHFRILPLKYFFSEAMQTTEGEEVSSREIKKILQECIENEDKKKPLTDEKLSAILKEKGYNIARRTVAKYREQLELPVARLRKELS